MTETQVNNNNNNKSSHHHHFLILFVCLFVLEIHVHSEHNERIYKSIMNEKNNYNEQQQQNDKQTKR